MHGSQDIHPIAAAALQRLVNHAQEVGAGHLIEPVAHGIEIRNMEIPIALRYEPLPSAARGTGGSYGGAAQRAVDLAGGSEHQVAVRITPQHCRSRSVSEVE